MQSKMALTFAAVPEPMIRDKQIKPEKQITSKYNKVLNENTREPEKNALNF